MYFYQFLIVFLCYSVFAEQEVLFFHFHVTKFVNLLLFLHVEPRLGKFSHSLAVKESTNVFIEYLFGLIFYTELYAPFGI